MFPLVMNKVLVFPHDGQHLAFWVVSSLAIKMSISLSDIMVLTYMSLITNKVELFLICL